MTYYAPARSASSDVIKKYINTPEQKENDKFPGTNPEVTGIYNLNDRELKIVIIKKLNKLQENSERHFNELRDKIKDKKKYFTKQIETIKKIKQKFYM